MIVLDTHVWLWHVAGIDKLSDAAQVAIDDADVLGVSAISCWEVAMLVERRRIRVDRPVREWLAAALNAPRCRLLALTPGIAVTSRTLGLHGDPADRIIAATAVEYRAPLVTKDERLGISEAVQTVW